MKKIFANRYMGRLLTALVISAAVIVCNSSLNVKADTLVEKNTKIIYDDALGTNISNTNTSCGITPVYTTDKKNGTASFQARFFTGSPDLRFGSSDSASWGLSSSDYNYGSIEFWIKIPDNTVNLKATLVYKEGSTDYKNAISGDYLNQYISAGEYGTWKFLKIPFSAFSKDKTITGAAFDWSKVNSFAIYANNSSGANYYFYLDDIKVRTYEFYTSTQEETVQNSKIIYDDALGTNIKATATGCGTTAVYTTDKKNGTASFEARFWAGSPDLRLESSDSTAWGLKASDYDQGFIEFWIKAPNNTVSLKAAMIYKDGGTDLKNVISTGSGYINQYIAAGEYGTWKYLQIPFSAFSKDKAQSGAAFDWSKVTGFCIYANNTSGANYNFYLDDFKINTYSTNRNQITDFNIYNGASGSEVATALQANGVIRAKASFDNKMSTGVEALLLLVCSRDGVVVDLKAVPANIKTGQTGVAEIQYTLPSNIQGYSVKALLWNSINQMQPIAEALPLNP